MTKAEPFLSAKGVLVSAIVMTCLSFIYILFALSGAITYGSPFFMAWGLVVALMVPVSFWLEFARRRSKPS